VTDWLPTIVAAAGGNTARNLPLDGIDIWSTLCSGSGESPRKEMLYGINPLGLSTDWFTGGLAGPPKAALRVGDFKVLAWGYAVRGIDGANTTGPLNAPPGTVGADPDFTTGVVMYNLATDERESRNLAHLPEHAATLQSMLARLKQLAEEQVYPMSMVRPWQGPHYECAACPQHPATGFTGDFAKMPWGPWM
jgi:arylsulfatase A-like enzyme